MLTIRQRNIIFVDIMSSNEVDNFEISNINIYKCKVPKNKYLNVEVGNFLSGENNNNINEYPILVVNPYCMKVYDENLEHIVDGVERRSESINTRIKDKEATKNKERFGVISNLCIGKIKV